ncbi:MAG: hypothetical protein AAF514_19425 [Verrucomicrobiota bacterium]
MRSFLFYLLFFLVGLGIGILALSFMRKSGTVETATVETTINRPTLLGNNGRDSLFSPLPELPTGGMASLEHHLALTKGHKSPLRYHTRLHRWLIDLARDPDNAPAILRALDGRQGASVGRMRSTLLRKWAALAPEKALTYTLGLDNPSQRSSGFRSVVETWALKDAEAAIATLKALPEDRVTREGIALALNKLSDQHPERALQLARGHSDEERVKSLETKLIRQQAATNIEATWARIEAIEDGEWRQTLQTSAIDALADNDRPSALHYAEKLAGQTRNVTIRRIFSDWPLSQAEEAGRAFANYSAKLPDGTAFAFGQSMNLADSEKALTFADSLEAEVKRNYLMGVLTEQGIKQPAKTARIAHEYVDGDTGALERIYLHLAESWAGKDEYAAADWLATLEPSPARDQAIKGFATRLINTDRERALQWAQSVGDPGTKERLVAELNRRSSPANK